MWLFAIETMFMTIAEDFVSHNKTATPGQFNIDQYLPSSVLTCVLTVQKCLGLHCDLSSLNQLEEARTARVSLASVFFFVFVRLVRIVFYVIKLQYLLALPLAVNLPLLL